ncbi:hypothetical protein CC77DRAFT_1062290 [Alternaria alternata]|uniref:Uncharacterized protein n=1 Tax=Alternaria alternata TaxID=5599 RepID=A0A177DLC8_ALTAL|nr:hypothetical protein CC77DRAFT_1062290 [Alternaria alternata]OAG19961.1 hypothetical protein CC77DRAFT_1062290 [Alternaria alternata]
MPQLPTLPRELIDHIISSLIALYDHDPAYQWTYLRHITRHHKAHLEQNFLRFWIPKLSFQIGDYHRSRASAEFQALKQPCNGAYSTAACSNAFHSHPQTASHTSLLPLSRCACCLKPFLRSGLQAAASLPPCDQSFTGRNEDADIITFKEMWGLSLSDVPQGWPEEARRSNDRKPWEQLDLNVIVRFGQGTLNRGYTKGGMRNDIIIPGFSINVDTSPWEFSFDWKALFTRLFTEEMVMRTFRDKLLEAFVPTLEEENMSPELRKSAIHRHLRNHFYDQRRTVLAAYRRYKYSPEDNEHDSARYPCSPEQGRGRFAGLHSEGQWVCGHIRCDQQYAGATTAGHGADTRSCWTRTQRFVRRERPFDFTPYVYRGGEKLFGDLFEHFEELDIEESMVFQVPNWETLAIRDILQLRVGEDMVEVHSIWPEDVYGYSDQIHGFLCKEYFEGHFKEGKERHPASDVVLEKRLREDGELDLEAFWP